MNQQGIVVGVAAVIWRSGPEVLLIRRTKPPKSGEWSLPGGKVEPGEPLILALKREIREETGLEIEVAGLIDVAELIEAGRHFVLVDYAARVLSGEAVAASDAADATWVPLDALAEYPMWEETRRIIIASERQAFPSGVAAE